MLEQQECEYLLTVLRKKRNQVKEISSTELATLSELARGTCHILTENMTKPIPTNDNFFHNLRGTEEACLMRVLLRVGQLYQARTQAMNILRSVGELEFVMSTLVGAVFASPSKVDWCE